MNALDKKTKAHLIQRLTDLLNNPFKNNQDIKKLKNMGTNTYRLRVGKIRIIFSVIEGEVMVHNIDYRGNIY